MIRLVWQANSGSGRADEIKALRTIRGCISELIMPGRDFGREAKARPVVHKNRRVCCAQNREVEPGCVSKRKLDRAGGRSRRLREKSRDRHHACRVKQLGGRTGVGVVKTSRNQNLAGWEQGREMVATPANQWQG